MRKVICGIALGALLALTNIGLAQSGETPPPPPAGGYGHWGHGPMNPAAQAAHMAKRLGLSSDQQSKVQSILTSQQTSMKALNENQTITHQQWLTQTRALHEQTKSQIEGLLTDTQKAQLAQMHGPHGDREGPPPPPPSEEQ